MRDFGAQKKWWCAVIKDKKLIGVVAFVLMGGFYHLSQKVWQVDYVPDVMAAVATTGPSVACTDPNIAAFQGSLAYTITWAAASAGNASNPSATATLSNPVNGDTAPTIAATMNGSGAAAGFVILTSTSPSGKIGGLQCQTNTDELKIEIHGDGVDNTKFDFALQNMADANNIYTGAQQCDNATSTAKDVLFGTSGQISTNLMLDGTRDFDGVADGEIMYGGTNETHGAMEIHLMVDFVEYNVVAGTDTETMTFTLTTQ